MQRLSFIDSYQYSRVQREKIDDELQELYCELKAGGDVYSLYNQIRQYIYREIKIDELAITRVLNDLLQIKLQNQTAYTIILFFVANPLYSYSEIAEQYGVTKQYIHALVFKYAQNYKWLQNLRNIKGQEDVKYLKKPQKKQVRMKLQQMELFDDEESGQD